MSNLYMKSHASTYVYFQNSSDRKKRKKNYYSGVVSHKIGQGFPPKLVFWSGQPQDRSGFPPKLVFLCGQPHKIGQGSHQNYYSGMVSHTR